MHGIGIEGMAATNVQLAHGDADKEKDESTAIAAHMKGVHSANGEDVLPTNHSMNAKAEYARLLRDAVGDARRMYQEGLVQGDRDWQKKMAPAQDARRQAMGVMQDITLAAIDEAKAKGTRYNFDQALGHALEQLKNRGIAMRAVAEQGGLDSVSNLANPPLALLRFGAQQLEGGPADKLSQAADVLASAAGALGASVAAAGALSPVAHVPGHVAEATGSTVALLGGHASELGLTTVMPGLGHAVALGVGALKVAARAPLLEKLHQLQAGEIHNPAVLHIVKQIVAIKEGESGAAMSVANPIVGVPHGFAVFGQAVTRLVTKKDSPKRKKVVAALAKGSLPQRATQAEREGQGDVRPLKALLTDLVKIAQNGKDGAQRGALAALAAIYGEGHVHAGMAHAIAVAICQNEGEAARRTFDKLR